MCAERVKLGSWSHSQRKSICKGDRLMDILPSKSSSHKPCFKCGEKPRAPGKSRCSDCYGEWKRAYCKRTYNSKKTRAHHLQSKFNLTQEEYDLMFFRQGGMCAVCGKQEAKIHPVSGRVWPLATDHNHETGQVRELLCNRCNVLLGRIERDRSLVKKLVNYLKKHDR